MRAIHFEDDPIKQVKLAREIRANGISDIEWARNLEEGVRMIEAEAAYGNHFDLVITDMHFPVRAGEADVADAGEQLIKLLNEKEIRVPVIVCSSVNYKVAGAYG